MNFFKYFNILGLTIFMACNGIAGKEKRGISPKPAKEKVKVQAIDSIRLYYDGLHRVKRGQKSIKRS